MPTLLTPKELMPRLRDVRLLSLDVDGVLTDGGMYYDDHGGQMRRFNVKDGMGIKRVMAAGVAVCIISASKTPSIQHRADTLGITHVRLGVEDKLGQLNAIVDELGISLAEVAHIGDDINDLPVLAAIGLPLTVADGVDEVRGVVSYITQKTGGHGAVREICDLLVQAKA